MAAIYQKYRYNNKVYLSFHTMTTKFQRLYPGFGIKQHGETGEIRSDV